MRRGKYIVLEGPEGVGKTVIVQRLADRFHTERTPMRIMHEPDNQNDLIAHTIHRITRDPTYTSTPRTSLLLINAARIQLLETIRRAIDNGVTCLVDCSYLSTIAIEYYGRGDIQDYGILNEIINFTVGDMQPDLTIVLDAPVATLRERMELRNKGADHPKEFDDAFYERIRAGYLWEAKQRNFPVVHAVGAVDAVFESVWQHVATVISARSESSRPQSVAEVLATNPPSHTTGVEHATTAQASTDTPSKATDIPETPPAASEKTEYDTGSMEVTAAGKTELAKYVTSTKSPVYGFTDDISPASVAVAMARFSRQSDDMRVVLLDELARKEAKDTKPIYQRAIAAYGDDSIGQLAGQHIMIENASNLLTKKLESGRLASYIEQPTHYIHFDQKDTNGRYRYFVPENLPDELRGVYERTMDQIFDTYSKLVSGLTAHIRVTSTTPAKEQDTAWRNATKAQAYDTLRSLLPLATNSTIGVYASGQALENLIVHLLSDGLSEARTVGQQILLEARKTAGAIFLENTDEPERGGAFTAYRANTYANVKKLASKLLPPNHTAETTPVTLDSFTPRNELDIVADMLYEHSDLPLEQLQEQTATWPYQRKIDVFNAYIGERFNRRHKPGRALEKVHYSFDLVCDYGSFHDLQRHRMVDDIEWQMLSPRLGYDIPNLVDAAGLSEAFEQCFDLSLQLYSTLQAAGQILEAQYATLTGHKMRWKVTYNAREAFHLHELRTTPRGDAGCRKLVQEMHRQVSEVHPLIAGAMKFVDLDEDTELIRLGAERYAHYKLTYLGGV
ncbi:MAG TPA: FAD-dependent thymidylate synthase [Verrucomicrobiae bacterium]|nr:FAD-dependent thymidylate synthase [Verrucomicrobiae bacterium]